MYAHICCHCVTGANGPIFSLASEEEAADVVDGEEEANVEEELPSDAAEGAILKGEGSTEGEAEDTDESTLKPHPDVDVKFVFTKPAAMGLELPAGKEVNFLVGFENKGAQDFVVESMDASFRYAMDFSFHIQNFSSIAYTTVVKPKSEATFAYSFFVSDAYSTRPYGLTVNLYYKDAEGNQYANAAFNETVSIIEIDEGLDTETFFLYVFLVAFVVLIIVVLQQFVLSKKRLTSKPKIEVGTTNANDVDYDWLPQETLNALNKSPKVPKTSPRQRRVKRTTGSADDK
ncbi:Translocon-associated protein subunit alpha-like protein [Leptotrombidium deliense]|uniref:Translocon-associated protein subunit alpha n=1 Tax=Leptotrombidium deliense TaxID=299467 RepID=A0A443SR64_9ACAR|nr:Translocon-associated protein subunit alpha-like protein [Leptotrombidium deliense]